MSKYIHKSHNVSVLVYHVVCPAKYWRVVFDRKVDEELRSVCLEIEKRYPMYFLEIGTDKEHVYFLVQSVPAYSISQSSQNNQKHYGQRDIFTLSSGQEATLGWKILV